LTTQDAQNDPTPQIAQAGILKREWWRTSLSIWGYIAKALATPFVMSLIVIMFVFLLQFLMRFIDKIVGRGLDMWTIAQLIAYNLAWMVVLAVPMAVLVSCVMAFGQLSASNEMTAMKAAGVSLGRMLFPVLVLGILIGFFDLQFNNKVLPDANHMAKDLMSDIQRKKPTFVMEPGQFSDESSIPGYSILARQVDQNTGDLKEVTIYDNSQHTESRVLTADRAKVAFTRDFKNIILTLRDGEMHQFYPFKPEEYRRGNFETYVVQVPTSGFDFMRQGESERSDRELSAQDLMVMVRQKDTLRTREVNTMKDHLETFARDLIQPTFASGEMAAAADAQNFQRSLFQPRMLMMQNDFDNIRNREEEIDAFMVEIHKKYSIPVACVVFVLLGSPLGALARRSGIGPGVGYSIGFFVLYWIFLIGGEKLADRNVIAPWVGMWGGNILLGVLGIYLTWVVAVERPAFQWIRHGWALIPKPRFRKRKPVEDTIIPTPSL
jgi:lipopolysaccharide export system permease protein